MDISTDPQSYKSVGELLCRIEDEGQVENMNEYLAKLATAAGKKFNVSPLKAFEDMKKSMEKCRETS